MPRSRIAPEIRYGESGFASWNPTTGQRKVETHSRNLDLFHDDLLFTRIRIFSDSRMGIEEDLDTRPAMTELGTSEELGNAGSQVSYWEGQPTHEEVYIAGPNLNPLYYRDWYGQWWKQVAGCDYTKCGPDGEGAWCCRHTMREFPFRKEEDKDAEFATCRMLDYDKSCMLHKAHLSKPFQCVMSPTAKDIEWYMKNGKCTVRWRQVRGPDE